MRLAHNLYQSLQAGVHGDSVMLTRSPRSRIRSVKQVFPACDALRCAEPLIDAGMAACPP